MATQIEDTAGVQATALELVELELALNHQDCIELGFEGTVRRALKQIGGNLLFHMRLDGMEGCDWVAAVWVESSEGRLFALVAQPTDGGALRVEDAATSTIPLARIVPAYAGILDTLEPVA